MGQFPNDVLNPGAVAEIRRTVIKRVGRSTVFQIFQAKNKDIIVVWRLDLNRILHVLNIRSAVFTLLPPTVSLQTELTMNIHVIDFDTHHDVDIPEEISSQVRAVSASRTQSIDGWMLLVAEVRTGSAASTAKESNNSYLGPLCLESCLPRRQGPVSVATLWGHYLPLTYFTQPVRICWRR